MAQIPQTTGLAGLLVPDPRITPDTWSGSVAACSRAGPRPGQAVPDQTGTQLLVAASGVQDDTIYRLRIQRGGFPERAEYAWATVTGGTTGTYRGCNFPNFAQDLRHIGAEASASAAGHPATCTTKTGRVVVAWGQTVVGINSVHVSYSDDRITWTGADASIVVLSEDPASDYYLGLTLASPTCTAIRWDDQRERVQLWIRTIDPAFGNTYQVHLWESADDGETWELIQRDTLMETWTADETPREMVVGEVAGALVLVMPNDDGADYYTAQWVSTDHGRTFQLLESVLWDKEHVRFAEHQGRLVAVAVSTADDIEVVTLTSAWTALSTADWVATGLTSAGTVALAVQHGQLYLVYSNATDYRLNVVASDTGGADDWRDIGHNLLSFGSAGNNVDISFLSATPAGGGLCLALKLSDTGVDSDLRGRLFALRCGEWSSVTLPPTAATLAGRGRVAFGPPPATVGTYWAQDQNTWYPACLPTVVGYTATGTGTVAIDVDDGDSPRLDISCAPGVQQNYAEHFTADPAKGILVYFDALVSAGGSTSSNDSGITIVLSDGATEYSATIRLSASGGLYLHDEVGGATSSMLVADVVTRHAYIAAIREIETGTSARISVYRVGYTSLDAYQAWEEVGGLNLDPETGSPAADSSITWAVLGTGSGVTITQKWYALHYVAVSGSPGGHDLALSWSPPTHTGGAPCSPTASELRNGLRLAFRGGPGKVGETYLLTPRYDYAVEHIYPHMYPSPRDGWRSVDDGSDAVFTWLWDSTDDWPEGLGSSAWGVALLGINFAAATWEGYTAAGAWETILSLDASTGLSSLPYRVAVRGTVRGPYLTVDTGGSGSAGRYIHENELAGGTVAIGSARFKILRNTSGTWSTTAGKKPVLFLDPDTWDTATATTGTCSIWAPSMVGIKHGLGSTEYRRLRLTIATQTTVDDDFRIGQLIMGPVVGFGRRYSYGRTWTMEPGAEVVDLTGGARASTVAAPARRVATFAWSDGVATRQLYADTVDPDYITAGSSSGVAHALATRDDLHTLLEGVLARDDVAGGHLPVVFLPALTYLGASSSEIITDPHRFLYGRVVSSVSMSMPIGTEEDTEIVQVGEIRVEGER